MFNFDDRRSPEAHPTVVSLRAVKQSAEERRRDVFDSHRHRVFALAYYMTGNELEAEEVMTHTFVDAFKQSDEPDAPMVDSALVGQLRTRFDLGEEEPVAVANSSPELSNRNVRRTDLEEAIQYLPATERLLFLMRDVEGYSTDAIAKLVELPEATVQRTLFSARLRLRGILANAQPDSAAA